MTLEEAKSEVERAFDLAFGKRLEIRLDQIEAATEAIRKGADHGVASGGSPG
jgi:hypothetical protein